MAVSLTERLRGLRGQVVDKTINGAGLQLELSARYGYGLTVEREDHTYVFHLPDAANDPVQARMIRQAALPQEDALLRLRRRAHKGSVILDACCGCGARPVFFAKSMEAKRVYALGTSAHSVALTRKNVLLNDMEDIVRAYWLNVTGEKLKGPFASMDKFVKDQKVDLVDVLSLDANAGGAVSGGGAEELISRFGPAVVFWGQDATAEQVKGLTDMLAAQGYKQPERWTSEILYWVPHI